MRLDKYLAHSGIGTRKEVKNMIRKKRVSVNDEICTSDDVKIDEVNDIICVDGTKVEYYSEVYIMLNKPAGCVSATMDERYPTVMDYIDANIPFDSFPVGRLDIDTVGLCFITNNGALAHEMLSPKKHVDKTYYVEVKEKLNDFAVLELEKGIALNDEEICLPAKVEMISETSCYLTIQEGKFHQIKRMMHAVDNEVTYLKRIRMSTLVLDESLDEGEWRFLTDEEVENLKNRNERTKA